MRVLAAIVVSLTLLLLSSCSRSGTPVDSKFVLANIGDVVGATGAGAILSGVSDNGEKFLIGLDGDSAFEYEKTLDSGKWSFYAITWDGDLPMTGNNYCASVKNTEISGEDADIELHLTQAACLHSDFSIVSSDESISGFEAGSNLFKEFKLQSCLTLSAIEETGDICQPHLLPESMSYRVRLLASDNTSSSSPPTLTSHCIGPNVEIAAGEDLPNLSESSFDTFMRIPIGGSANLFPFEILAYDRANCEEESFNLSYKFSNVTRTEGSDQSRYRLPPSPTGVEGNYNLFTFPDNFTGYGKTPLANHIFDFRCGGVPCHQFNFENANPYSSLDHHFRSALRTMEPVLANMNSLRLYELEGRRARYSYDGINFEAESPGEHGNGISIYIKRDDTYGSILVDTEGSHDFEIFFPAGTENHEVESEFYNEVYAYSEGQWDAPFAPNLANEESVTLYLEGGEGAQISSRDHSINSRINFAIAGGIAGIIYDKGYTSCESLPTDGSTFSDTINLGDFSETVHVEFNEAQKSYPDLAGNTVSLEKRITIIFPLFEEVEHYEFSCTAGLEQYGWHYIEEQYEGRYTEKQTYWTPDFVEYYSIRSEDGNTEKSITRIKNDFNPGEFNIWSTHTYPSHNGHERYAISSNGTLLDIHYFEDQYALNSNNNFLEDAIYQSCFTFETGDYEFCSIVNENPDPPILLSSWSVRDLTKELGDDTLDIAVGDQIGHEMIYAGEFVDGGTTYYLATTPGGCDGFTPYPYCDGTDDTDISFAWASFGEELIAGSETDGLGNTISIVTDANHSETDAANYCDDLTYSDYSDWYLPALDELLHLYNNRFEVGGFATNEKYWSSTDFVDPTKALTVDFFDGNFYEDPKTTANYTRCLRRL